MTAKNNEGDNAYNLAVLYGHTELTPGTWPSARCHKPARPGTLGADLLADRAH